MPRHNSVITNEEGVVSTSRKKPDQSAAEAPRDDVAAQRTRRLRRKALAQKVVAHWKSFAREGIAEARARAHASASPRRRALARWRRGAATLRAARLRCAADAGRRRFLGESRGFAAWRAAARARSAARRAGRESARAASAHRSRAAAAAALCRWRGAASLAVARRGMEEAALRAWASGRLYSGLAGLRRNALKHRLGLFLLDRGASGRRRLLGRKGLAGLEAALLRAAGERDVVAEAVAGRARAALARWVRRTSVLRARRAIRAEETCLQASRLRPGKLHRALQHWRQFSANRRHFRRIVVDISTISGRSPAAAASAGAGEQRRVTGAPAASATAASSAVAAAAAGRARAAASLRQWRRAVSRRRQARACAGLAEEFRHHVLLLRHHEHWKAFARSGRAAAALAAAAERLGRRARMRRALLALGRAAEESAAERDRVRPLLRKAFFGWDEVCADALRKREGRREEASARDRRSKRRALRAWSRRAQDAITGRESLFVGERQHCRRRLHGALRDWAVAAVEAGRRRAQAESSRGHADRRRQETAVRVWRAAAADLAVRRSANATARKKARRSLVARMLRGWRERADLQAARKAVFCARVASATRAVAEGKLRRSLARWQEVHGSARVASITRLRAEGHARRKILARFWRAWVSAQDLQRRRKAFRAKVKARQRLCLQQEAFSALAAVAEEARRSREQVGAALLLWKLHTQGKAFAALAAHRLRRRWKQDRARRATGWRRERLIRDGALRWAATADAIAASRISSAAFREGSKAARRWEAAGRCARHWRRVAAARGMERRRRARDGGEPTAPPPPPGWGCVVTTLPLRTTGGGIYSGGFGGSSSSVDGRFTGEELRVAGGTFAAAPGAGVLGGESCGGGGESGGWGGSRSRVPGAVAAGSDSSGAGKENRVGGGSLVPQLKPAATGGDEPAACVVFQGSPWSSSRYQDNGAVNQASGTAASTASVSVPPGSGSEAADRRGDGAAGTPPGRRRRLDELELPAVRRRGGPAADAAATAAALAESGLADSYVGRWKPSSEDASPVARQPLGGSLPHAAWAGNTSDHHRRRPAPMRPLVALAGGSAPKEGAGGALSSLRCVGGSPGGEGGGEERAPAPGTVMAVSDLTHGTPPLAPTTFAGDSSSRGRGDDAEAAAAAAGGGGATAAAGALGFGGSSVDGDGGAGRRRRRPAPRRPLELLLDETAPYSAAAASDGGQRRGGGEGRRVAPPAPLSAWVVDEMNRLFGVRGMGIADSDSAGAAGNQGQGYRSGAVLGRVEAGDQSQDARRSSGGHGLSWSAGAHAVAKTSPINVAPSPPNGGRWTGGGGLDQRYQQYQQEQQQHLQQHQYQHQHQHHHHHHRLHQEQHQRAPPRAPPTATMKPPPQPPPAQQWKENRPASAAAAGADRERNPVRAHGVGPTLYPTSVLPSAPAARTASAIETWEDGSPVPSACSEAVAGATATERGPERSSAREVDGGGGEGEKHGSAEGAPLPPPAFPPLVTDDVDLTVNSTPGSRSTGESAAASVAAASQDVSTPPAVAAAATAAASAESSSFIDPGVSTVVPERSQMVPPPSPSLLEEQALEARVADAERRLAALQEHARRRRRYKRELAALHQALAEQERETSGGSSGGGGDAGFPDGDVGLGLDVGGGWAGAVGERAAVSRSNPRRSPVLSSSSPSPNAPLPPPPAAQDEEIMRPPPSSPDTADGASPPVVSDTSSRRALLVRMGFVRARLEAGGTSGEDGSGLRPVAESLWREVDELAKSGAAGGGGGGGARG